MAVGTGPEAVYAEMTSGNAGTIRGLGADTIDVMTRVRDSIELIRYAEDRPDWDSDAARRSYNMRAWATRASAEQGLDRAEARVSRLNLPVSSLGEVPGAGPFTTTVDTHLATTATWIGESRISSGTTADALIATANDYEEADQQSNNLFGLLQRFIS